MQEKYVGDTPDFGKYVLLRALCDPQDNYPSLRLGVNWYLTLGDEVDRLRNRDGEKRHHATMPERFKAVDCDLWHRLDKFQHHHNRTIYGIERAGVLPDDTIYYSAPLTLARYRRNEKIKARSRWAMQGVSKLGDADLVFVDPDTGFEIKSTKRHHKKGPKYVFYDELMPYIDRQQSLVAIQFMGMQKGGVPALACQISERINRNLGYGGPILTVRFCAGSAILYFVLPAAGHEDILKSRLDRFLVDKGSKIFKSIIY